MPPAPTAVSSPSQEPLQLIEAPLKLELMLAVTETTEGSVMVIVVIAEQPLGSVAVTS